ncbi:MAG: hypothetical protein KH050_12710 [Clostridiaceae bacterium]|nr:hypothetical protein [Clostridiaceae bacterium]
MNDLNLSGINLSPEEDDFAPYDPFGMADPSPCPCCTAEFPMPPHAGDICLVCGWEIDPEAESAPEQSSEANHGLSLSEAQMNFRAFGICDPSLRWNE